MVLVGPVDPANYHPVSNFPFLGKLFEGVSTQQLQAFLDGSFIDPLKSVFWHGYRMEMELVVLMDDLQKHLDWSRSAQLLLLDQTEVFDTGA